MPLVNKYDKDRSITDLDYLLGSNGDLGGKTQNYYIKDLKTIFGLSPNATIADISGLQAALDGKVDDPQVLTNVPAGAVFTDTVYTLPFVDNSVNWNAAYAWGDHSGLYSLASHVHSISDVTGLQAALDAINTTGLESLDEGNGDGWRLIGRNSANYGNIGLGAADFSGSTSVSATLGATGDYSFAGSGYQLSALGDYSSVFGVNNEAYSFAETSLGTYGTVYSPASATSFDSTDRIFNIGIGPNSGARADLLTGFKDGKILAPSLTHSLIDSSTDQSLVTKGYGAVQYLSASSTRIVSGQVVYVSGLTWKTSNLVWVVNDVSFSSNDFELTLDAADGSNPRIDVIYGDDLGNVLIRKGTPAGSPVEPVIEGSHEIKFVIATIAAGALVPSGIVNNTVYLENDQEVGGEYDTAETTSGVRIDLANTSDPLSGTKDIKTISNLTTGDLITFSHSTPITLADFNHISMDIRALRFWGSDFIEVKFMSGASLAGSAIINKNSLDTTDLVSIQSVYLFPEDFSAFSETTFDSIVFYHKSTNKILYAVDNINIQTGSIIIPPAVTDHNDLENIGTNTHAQIDVHIAAANPHAITLEKARTSGNQYAGPVDYNNNAAQNLSSLGFQSGQAITWNDDYKTINIPTGEGAINQLGQELYYRIHNNTGLTITNGQVVQPNGSIVVGTETIPTVALAKADALSTCNGLLLVATHDILNGEEGSATRFGRVGGLDTSSWVTGGVYLSDSVAGAMTNTKPSFPSYALTLGGLIKGHASEGVIGIEIGSSITDTFDNFFNGIFRESHDFLITSDGVTITGTLEPSNGHPDMTMVFSDGLTILDTSPALTISLTAGTAAVPQMNYIYIPQSTKVLTVSTSDFPSAEHIRVATVYVRTAALTQTDGALINRNHTDHIQDTTTNQGHLQHLSERIRLEPAKWISGTLGTCTTDGTNVYIDIASGFVFQMHKQTIAALDMATGDSIHIVNDSVTAFDKVTNLNTKTLDSTGATLANRSFSVIVWGVSNKTGEANHMMANYPSGSYSKNSPDDAVNDADNYSVYSIPSEFAGTGFLVARFTFTLDAGGTTWVLYDTEDLRGKLPNATAGGGGGGGGVTDWVALTETPSSLVGSGLNFVRVAAGETALEFHTLVKADISDYDAIDGSITNDQVAFGAVTANEIEGNSNLAVSTNSSSFIALSLGHNTAGYIGYLSLDGNNTTGGGYLDLYNGDSVNANVAFYRLIAGTTGDLQILNAGGVSAFTIHEDLLAIEAPETSIADITTIGDKALITKQYADSVYVSGPASAVDENIAVFDSTSGKLIKDGLINKSAITANTAKVTNATHSGDVSGATVLTIGANKVTNAMLSTVATSTFKGRKTAATGNVEDLTITQAKQVLDDRILEDATVTGTQDLDYSLYETFNFTVTGAVTFTESNLPTSGTNGKVILINITGNFALTYPANWSTNIIGTYDGTVNNTIVVWYVKTGVYKVQITQPD